MIKRKKPLTAAMLKALELVDRFGCERIWRIPGNDGSWSWVVAGASMSQPIGRLYAAGWLEPDNGHPHKLKPSKEARPILAALARGQACAA
jgi:hypothetical protein